MTGKRKQQYPGLTSDNNCLCCNKVACCKGWRAGCLTWLSNRVCGDAEAVGTLLFPYSIGWCGCFGCCNGGKPWFAKEYCPILLATEHIWGIKLCWEV